VARKIIDAGGVIQTAGELNYAITRHFLDKSIGVAEALNKIRREAEHYVTSNGLSYGTINDVIGALECIRREVKRRRGFDVALFSSIADEFYDAIAAPYEDEKIQTNGDVY